MNTEDSEFERIAEEAKRRAAQAKLDDESDTLLIVYQRGFADGKRSAQQQAEPTPWRDMVVISLVREGVNKHRARELADHFAAQPEQEPVGKFAKFTDNIWREVTDGSAGLPLYTTPPQRPWVGLTDEDLDYLCHLAYTGDEEFALAVQDKLKELNT